MGFFDKKAVNFEEDVMDTQYLSMICQKSYNQKDFKKHLWDKGKGPLTKYVTLKTKFSSPIPLCHAS